MSTVIDREVADCVEEKLPTDGLFVVWFDLSFGSHPSDWWWEEPGPQPLSAALDMASDMRQQGWICKVMPEGENPRPDGRWDNP